eukprot:Skav206915  [mRNA]  locus=scaffold808:455075:459826:+ [translate_table: standard]
MDLTSEFRALVKSYEFASTMPHDMSIVNFLVCDVMKLADSPGCYVGSIVIPGLPTMNSFATQQFDLTQETRTDAQITFRCDTLPEKMLVSGDRVYLHAYRRQNIASMLMEPTEQSFVHPMDQSFHSEISAFEPFAGGYGGWSHALKHLADCGLNDVRVVALDNCIQAVVQYGMTHRANMVGGQVSLPWDFFLTQRENMVIHAGFNSINWKQALIILNPETWLVSSPCQPWSSSGSQRGFEDGNGFLLAEVWGLIRVARPATVGMEQVSAFRSHPDYELFLALVKWAGYRLVSMEVCDLKHVAACKRLRYLAIFVAQEFQHEDFAKATWPFHEEHTPRSLRAFINMTPKDSRVFQPSAAAASKYFDPSFMPDKQRKTKQAIIAWRVPGLDVQQPTYMHMYGQQHKLSDDRLRSKGLFGIFKPELDSRNNSSFRFWSPMEILAQHVHRGNAVLLKPPIISWQMLGNMIAMPHSVKVSYDIMKILADKPLPLTFHEVYAKLHEERIQFPQTQCSEDDTAWYVAPLADHSELKNRVAKFEHAMGWNRDPFPIWPDGKFYHHDEGLLCFGDFSNLPSNVQVEPTQHDSIETIASSCVPGPEGEHYEPSPTVPFEAEPLDFQRDALIDKTDLLPLQVALIPGEYGTFQVEKGTPLDAIMSLWNFSCEPLNIDKVDASAFESKTLMLPVEHTMDAKVEFLNSLTHIPILDRDEHGVVIRAIRKDQRLDDFLIERDINLQVWDHFGPVDVTDVVHAPMMIYRTPQKPHFCEPGSETFPELANVEVEAYVPKFTDIMVFALHGPAEEITQLRELWQQACTDSWLASHGRQLNWQQCADNEVRMLFRPKLPIAATPTKILLPLLMHRFAQFHLKRYELMDHGQQVRIKNHGVLLFEGLLSPDLHMKFVHNILRCAYHSKCFGLYPRLVARGKLIVPEIHLKEAQFNKRTAEGTWPTLTIQLIYPMWGGAGPSEKNKQHRDIMDEVAKLFLEAGCKMPKTNELVEELTSQVGLSRLSYLVRQDPSNRSRKFEELCALASIPLPEKHRSKQSADSKFRKLQLRMQSKQEPLDLAQLSICEGYFENEDGTAAVVARTFSPFTTGISLLTPEQLDQWLKGEAVLSGDELAAFVPEPCPTPLGFKFQDMTAPVHDAGGNLLLLKGRLYQFGSKEIKISKRLNQSQSTEDVKIIAFTMWRSDYDEPTWKAIVQQPVRQCKMLLQQQDASIQILQPWGRRYRDSKGETTPESCESIQFHALVPAACYATLIKRSGWNGIFATPKTADGKLVDTFRIIWTSMTVQELQTKIAVLAGCQGLVRGKRSHGIRVDLASFNEIWEIIKPGQVAPDLTPMAKTYRLEPLPYGVNKEALEAWASKHGWKIRAIRTLGGQQWLVGANQAPPSPILQFNGAPIIVKAVESKPPRRSGPILAGKAPSNKVPYNPSTFQELDDDPWAEFRARQGIAHHSQLPHGPSSSGATGSQQNRQERSVSGPIATQFDQQANRISNLEQQIGQLAEAQAHQSKQVEMRFEKMETDFRTHAEQTRCTVTSMQSELQKSIASAIQHQDLQLQSSMQDLKNFFLRGTKRKEAEEDEDEELM